MAPTTTRTTSRWLGLLCLSILTSSIQTATNNATESGARLDILQALNMSSAMRGVSQVAGLSDNFPAWRLHSSFDHVQMPAAQLLSKVDKPVTAISLHFVLRQHKKTVGTLLSINVPGRMSPWFRLTSNLKNGPHLVLFYHIRQDAKLHQTSFDLPHVQNWTQVALSISGHKATLYINCRQPQVRQLVGTINLLFPKDALIYFRQEPGFKKKFLGSIQVAQLTLAPLNHRPWVCPS